MICLLNKKLKIDILELGLSQIYLNQRKLDNIKQWFDPTLITDYEPLPVFDFGNNKLALTDGHTRAFVAYTYGIKDIYVQVDNCNIVLSELGQKQYAIDIEWCKRFSLNSIADLSKRIVSDEMYQKLWIQRCDRIYNLLVPLGPEEMRLIKEKGNDLFLYVSTYYPRRVRGIDNKDVSLDFTGFVGLHQSCLL